MGKGAVTGKTFLSGVLSKITDPELRGQAEKVFADATVQLEIGNGVEGQGEIDRQLQDLRTRQQELDTRSQQIETEENNLRHWHGELTTWHQTNKDALEDYVRLKRSGGGGGGGGNPGNGGNPNPRPAPRTGPPADTDAVTVAQLNDQVTVANQAFLGFQLDQNRLLREHYARFGEILDVEPLVRHPKIREVGLQGVYEIVHKERLEKHATDTAKAAEEKIRADERQKVLAEQASMPYPIPTGIGSGSPLDALEAGKPAPVVDQAVAHYNRLQHERGAAR